MDGGDAGDADTGAGDAEDPEPTCTDDPIPEAIESQASVHFLFSGPATKEVITDGSGCVALDIRPLAMTETGEEPGSSLLLGAPYSPMCEGAPVGASPDGLVPASESPSITWDGTHRLTYSVCVDCEEYGWRGLGWQHRTLTVATAVPTGRYRATFAIAADADEGSAHEDVDPSNPGLCPNDETVSVDFELPESGEQTINVVVPDTSEP